MKNVTKLVSFNTEGKMAPRYDSNEFLEREGELSIME